MLKSSIIALAITTAAAMSASSYGALIEGFEDTNSLTTNYNMADTSGANKFINASSPSIGSNAIKAGGNNTLTYKNSTFSLAKGQSITTSVWVAQRTAGSNSNVLVQLGFGDKATDTFNNGAGYVSIFSRLINDDTTADSTQYHLAADNKSDANTAASENKSPYPKVKLAGGYGTNGHPGPVWYIYSLKLTRTDTNAFQTVSSLQYVGPNGTETPGNTVLTYTSDVYTNAAFAALADQGKLYAGIRSNTNSGALRLDNFAVSDPVATPEPAAAGAIGVGALLLGKRRRKSNKSN